jgi:hypothetical protein
LTIMQAETLPPRPALQYDARSALAAGICVAALFFNGLGWLLAIAGVFLLRGAVFQPRVKWILAGVALAPKILFLGARMLGASHALSFTIEPSTLATSSARWSLSILLVGIGSLMIYVPLKLRGAADASAPPTPDAIAEQASSGSPVFKAAGLALIALAIAMLLGLTDDFQRIEDAGNGRWALKHAVRGAVATFTRDELASIEGIRTRRSRGSSSYSVRVKLKDGRAFSASTASSAAFQDLRRFAVTADLRPGTVTTRQSYGGDWANGASGFTLSDCVGTYEYADERLGERSTFEFWIQNGRLGGKETSLIGQGRHVQTLRDIKISDTGEFEFTESPYAEVSEPAKSTMSFSFGWSAQGQTGRFTKDGLEIGPKRYRKVKG